MKQVAYHQSSSLFRIAITSYVDKFKEFNDTYGHIEGDKALQKVAQSMSVHAGRAGEVVAGYGGEEFAMLLPSMSQDALTTLAQNILDSVRGLFIPHCKSKVAEVVTISIGVANMVGRKDLCPSDLVVQADRALYQAKQNGRNRFVFAKSD